MRVYSGRDECSKYMISEDISEVGWNPKTVRTTKALREIKDKRRKEVDEVLRKANTAVTRAKNKQKEELRGQGVQARKDEKERLQYTVEIGI
jgi:hypothetical protein